MEPLSHGSFPLIFCRNVMIYFDRPTQEALVNRLAGCLEPGGYLFIGHSESLGGLDQPLKYIQPAIYRKPEIAAAPVPGYGGRK
jgi:chemotaxis protein methyltransferase CheR